MRSRATMACLPMVALRPGTKTPALRPAFGRICNNCFSLIAWLLNRWLHRRSVIDRQELASDISVNSVFLMPGRDGRFAGVSRLG